MHRRWSGCRRNIQRVLLASLEIGQTLGDIDLAGQAQHGVVVAFNFGLAGSGDGPVVGEGVGAAVEAGVYTCMPSLQLTWICLASPLYTTYGVSASAVSVTLPPETATVCSLVLPDR